MCNTNKNNKPKEKKKQVKNYENSSGEVVNIQYERTKLFSTILSHGVACGGVDSGTGLGFGSSWEP